MKLVSIAHVIVSNFTILFLTVQFHCVEDEKTAIALLFHQGQLTNHLKFTNHEEITFIDVSTVQSIPILNIFQIILRYVVSKLSHWVTHRYFPSSLLIIAYNDHQYHVFNISRISPS